MKRRFGGAPTGIRAIEKQMKKQQNEFKIKVQSKEWENAKPLEEIEVPEQFAKSQALRLWFLARCNAQGTFDAMAPETEMAHMRHHMLMMMPVPRFWRRLGIALQLIPIIGPQVLHLVSDTVWSLSFPPLISLKDLEYCWTTDRPSTGLRDTLRVRSVSLSALVCASSDKPSRQFLLGLRGLKVN